ncbi:hypothetical protein [Candidatus Enterococcus murrayae]|uniref:Uncharacterized protein n=1 Tax=Candidatus Enterococcus murrayae TaxID=2815321 RepID=A0ABS3HJW1_9ENTE|nr:hypothetical protein [Enterococcus sp. MJM16]MBO0453736.1 hypothetical protein [Enterococcus sp. MJM16]
MTIIIKPNTLFYIGIIIIVLNALFFDFNIFINILSFALILFSESILKVINSKLQSSH